MIYPFSGNVAAIVALADLIGIEVERVSLIGRTVLMSGQLGKSCDGCHCHMPEKKDINAA